VDGGEFSDAAACPSVHCSPDGHAIMMFERTVWHSAQHTRQIAAILEQAGVAPDRPLGADDIRGLPLTDKIWD
jgi:hypothetical protein